MNNFLRCALLQAIAAVTLLGQATVAPSREAVGRARGEDVGTYNLTNSFELGYRFRTLDGNESRYRSDVNFGNGVRLLGSRFTLNSKEGHGRLLDELVLTTQGLGNDPYQFASLRLEKNRLYRYDLMWRSNAYVNPGIPALGLDGHWLDTTRRMQDHDFTLLPQSRVRFLAGFSRNTQDGPGLLSGQYFDTRGDEFPLFGGIDRSQSEYRAGAEVSLSNFKFVVLRGWQRFREETGWRIVARSPGANPLDNTAINSLSRTEPYTGDTPFWRFNLLQDRKQWYGISARYSYAGGRRDFVFDDTASGTDRVGAARVRQITVGGAGRRPVSSGALTLSLFPSTNWTITNHTAFHQVAMDGDATYREVNNGSSFGQILRFRYLGLRSIVNSTDASFRASRWLGLYGGYHYSNRRIRSTEGERFGTDTSDVARAEQTNRLHSGLGGIRLQPVKPLSITFDGEIGRADRPFYPLSERNYHVLGSRVQYKTRTAQLSLWSRANYNTNSVSLFLHSARARTYAADASWSPRRTFGFDAGYSKIHIDTATGLAFFDQGALLRGESIYVSNVHAASISVRASLASRLDFHLGFNRVQDTGDGRSSASRPSSGARGASELEPFRTAQTLPMTYQSPLFRISVRLHDKVRWNFGYQLYDYGDDFFSAQNYRAHTGFASVIWSF